MFIRSRALCAAAFIVGSAPRFAAAGDATGRATPEIGQRVRVFAPSVLSTRVAGTIVSADDKKLVILGESRPQFEILRSEITQLELSRGTRGHAALGAAIGAGVGLLGGLAIGAAYCSGEGGDCHPESGAILAPVGAAAGLLIGALVRTERWEKLPLQGLSLSILPLPRRGVSLAVQVAF